MLVGVVSIEPGTSNTLTIPSLERRKPCNTPKCPVWVQDPVIAPAGLMLVGAVNALPHGAAKLVKVPSGARRKPRTPKPAPSYCPVIAPAELMLVGKVKIEPKGSKVVRV